MQTVSILNFERMPDIRSKVYLSEILPLKGKYVIKPDNHTHFLVMLSGSANYKVLSEGAESSEKAFHSNHILILPEGKEAVITATTQTCQLLHIRFDLFVTGNLDDALIENSNPNFTYSKMQLFENCSSISSFEENFPSFQSDIHNLILHCKLFPTDLDLVAFPLNTILYSMLCVQFSTTVNVLRSVKAVVFATNKFKFSNPFSFSVSDIVVYSHRTSSKISEEVCSIPNKHIFIEKPGNKEHYRSYFTDDDNCRCKSAYNFDQSEGNLFKVWLFPEGQLPSLEEHKSNGVISFKMKANQPGSLLMQLYHIPSYQSINYQIEITEPNVWTEFEVPISNNTSLNAMLPYIEKAVRYIQDNFSEKITINDIAKHVTIHPSYLSALFRKNLNQSVNSYINFYRINVAKQLLRNEDTSITDIALQTGFYDAQHFLKTFKKNTGFTPSEYRNM